MDLAVRRAPIALAICGAISIWIGPSIWLHGELKGIRDAVQANAVSIASNTARIESVEASLIRLESKVDQLSGKVDQLIFYLMEGQQ